MMRLVKICSYWLLLGSSIALAPPASAQLDATVDDVAAPAEDEASAGDARDEALADDLPANDAVDGDVAEEEAAPADAATPPAEPLPPPSDPTVKAVIEQRPQTPADRIRCAVVLCDLGQPAYGRTFLAEVLTAQFDDEALAALRARFGMATFVRLANEPTLAPEAARLAEQVLAAAERVAQDPQRLTAAIQRLADPQPAVAHGAEVTLREAGPVGAVHLLAALADERQAPLHRAIQRAIVAMGADAVPLLITAVRDPRPAVASRAVEVLALSGGRTQAAHYLAAAYVAAEPLCTAAQRALESLLGQVPPQERAAGILARMAREYYTGERWLAADVQGSTVVWLPQAQSAELVSRRVPVELANARRAAQYAADAALLSNADPALVALAEVARLDVRGRIGWLGDQAPLPLEADRELDVAALLALLEQALRDQRPAAAVEILRRLARPSSEVLLLAGAPQLSPVVRALDAGDRRVRFAALQTIFAQQPLTAFPGLSRVTEALAYFIASPGQAFALVAHPQAVEAQRLAAMLTELGYETETALDGRELFHLATAQSDLEVLFLSPRLVQPETRDVLRQLALDGRTARVPVALIAAAEEFDSADRLAKLRPGVLAFPRPHATADLEWELHSLFERTGGGRVTPEERLAEAQQCLTWLIALARDHADWEISAAESAVVRAVWNPALSPRACEVLALRPSRIAQRTLLGLVNAAGQPLEARRAAAAAFYRHLAHYGAQLTRDELLAQYEHYNSSEHEPAEVQQLFSSVLDALEVGRTSLSEAANAPRNP